MKTLILTTTTILYFFTCYGQWSNIYDNQPVAYLDGYQHNQQVVADNNGGCYVIWQDARDRVNVDQIYAQHFDSLGNPQWQIDGIPLAPTGHLQNKMQAISDGQGGAFVIWRDLRDSIGPFSTNVDIWGQRIDASGPLWGSQGKGLILESGEQGDPLLISDQNGGFIFSFEDGGDFQSGRSKGYWMQRCDGQGNPVWNAGGKLVHQVSQVFSASVDLSLTSDGQQGGVLIWNEQPFSITEGNNIYGHRMDAAGNRHWPSDLDTLAGIIFERGYPVCTAPGHQAFPMAKSDLLGNIYLCWNDERDPNGQFGALFAQKVSIDGTSQWDSLGVQVNAGELGGNNQFDMLPDGLGQVYFNYRSSTDERVLVKLDSLGNEKWQTPAFIADNDAIMFSPMNLTSTHGVAIAWLATDINQNQENGIEAQLFDSLGQAQVAGNILLSSYPEDKGPVHIDVGPQDELFAAWMDWRRTNGQSGSNADADLFAQKWMPVIVGISPATVAPPLAFQLVPQPSAIHVFFAGETISDGEVIISDLSGRVLRQTSFGRGTFTVEVPIDDWARGLYLVTVVSDGQLATKRFIRP